MRALACLLRRWAGETRAASAVEFAIGAPVMILMLLMGVDTGRYVVATRRLEQVATTIGQMLSVNTTGTVSPNEMRFYQDSAMVTFPQVLADSKQQGIAWGNDISITISSVGFVQVAGIYVAKTVWSVGNNRRSCLLPLIAVADNAQSNPATLPQDAFGPGTLIVVDVSFTFRPTIASQYLPNLTIARSFYIQPRYVAAVTYTGLAGYLVSLC